MWCHQIDHTTATWTQLYSLTWMLAQEHMTHKDNIVNIMDHSWGQKYHGEREPLGPRRELTTIIPLDEHSIKLILNNSSLYSWISISLNPHQWNFFLYWEEINIKTHNWSASKTLARTSHLYQLHALSSRLRGYHEKLKDSEIVDD